MQCFFWLDLHHIMNKMGPLTNLALASHLETMNKQKSFMYINCNMLLISMNIEIYFMISEHIGCYFISQYFINNGLLQFSM